MQAESRNRQQDSNCGAGAGGSSESGRDVLFSARTKLEELAQTQDALSQERKEVLIERTRLSSSGKAVQAQRVVTGDAEVHFMNLLRRLRNECKGEFPQALSLAYDKVLEERDKLGTMEEEYLQAERSFGGSEWRFIQKENIFYQYDIQQILADEVVHTSRQDDTAGLVHSAPPPTPAPPLSREHFVNIHGTPPPPPPPPPIPNARIVKEALPPPPPPPQSLLPTRGPFINFSTLDQQYQSAIAELDRLRKEFNSLRSEQSRFLDSQPPQSVRCSDQAIQPPCPSEFYEIYSSLLTRISECEVKVQHLKQETMQYDNLNTYLSRRMSDPMHVDKRPVSPFDTVTRAETDGVLPVALENPAMKFRIRDWLWDYMKSNAIERTVYFNILERFGIPVSNPTSLEDCAEQYWPPTSTDRSHESLEEESSATGHSVQPLQDWPTSSPVTHSQKTVMASNPRKVTNASNVDTNKWSPLLEEEQQLPGKPSHLIDHLASSFSTPTLIPSTQVALDIADTHGKDQILENLSNDWPGKNIVTTTQTNCKDLANPSSRPRSPQKSKPGSRNSMDGQELSMGCDRSPDSPQDPEMNTPAVFPASLEANKSADGVLKPPVGSPSMIFCSGQEPVQVYVGEEKANITPETNPTVPKDPVRFCSNSSGAIDADPNGSPRKESPMRSIPGTSMRTSRPVSEGSCELQERAAGLLSYTPFLHHVRRKSASYTSRDHRMDDTNEGPSRIERRLANI